MQPEYDCKPQQQQARYFIQYRDASVGNCALWWRPAAEGYTTDLEQAGRFTADEVQRYVHRSIDRALPCEAVEAVAVRHVRVESLKGVGHV